MTVTLNPKITNAGLALMPTGDATGFSVQLTHIAIGLGLYSLGGTGDADDTAARSMVALKNEIARYAISSGTNPNATSIQIGTTITDTDPNGKSPNGKSIGEIGFYAGNTLWAVWSRADSALFVKSAGFDIPFAYTLDTSAFPQNSVTVTVATDPQGMAALILQHKAEPDPHPQYATDADVAALTAVVVTKQPLLGFTPVQQGGVTGQGANKIAIGLASDGSGALKVSIDNVDKGGIALLASPVFSGVPQAPTAAAGTSTKQLATTEFVTAAISTALVGQIAWEPRTSARAGYLKLNGALLNRADYPALWAYAQSSGALVTEAQWSANSFGCFSSGDNATTFRIPEVRGESIRCWDDSRGVDTSRGIGTWQDGQNLSHIHAASAAAVGDHAHSAWTDGQGAHSHNFSQQVPQSVGDTDRGSVSSGFSIDTPVWPWTDTQGTHGHNVGVGAAGGHSHTITIGAAGGTEVRVRSVAMLAMIRAY